MKDAVDSFVAQADLLAILVRRHPKLAPARASGIHAGDIGRRNGERIVNVGMMGVAVAATRRELQCCPTKRRSPSPTRARRMENHHCGTSKCRSGFGIGFVLGRTKGQPPRWHRNKSALEGAECCGAERSSWSSQG